jgi:hypothetical protein
MKKTSRSKTKRTRTRSVLRLLDLEHAKAAFRIVSPAQMPNEATATPSTSLSTGIVLNRD